MAIIKATCRGPHKRHSNRPGGPRSRARPAELEVDEDGQLLIHFAHDRAARTLVLSLTRAQTRALRERLQAAEGRGPLSPLELSATQVQAIRQRLGLSQAELATLVGVSGRSVSRWERGQYVPSPMASARLRELVS